MVTRTYFFKFLGKTRAFFYGLRDGWEQPYDVSSSRNVDHLVDVSKSTGTDAYEWLDRGINVGQALRAGRKSQSYSERYWPFSI